MANHHTHDFTADIKRAVEVLQQGGIILYPTDTVWGIGADSTNSDAVQKVFQLKKRNDAKALIVLLDTANKIDTYVTEVPEMAWELIEVSDQPLTLVYPGAKNLAHNLIAPDGSIAIRITSDPFCVALIRKFMKPIVSTSANTSGKLFKGSYVDVDEEILTGVDYVVTYRQDEKISTRPSSIIQIDVHNRIKVLRK